MSKFLDRYDVVENKKTNKRNNSNLSPLEKNRLKMLQSIDDQLKYVADFAAGHSISAENMKVSQKPRLFWQDTLGGYLFTPRFGNDFLFGKDRGVQCHSYDELRSLLEDFKSAVTNGEFDERITEIASTRKGRGAGISRNRS